MKTKVLIPFFLLMLATVYAQAQEIKMKMATDIPESIIMPDKVESRIGTLEFFDGFPTAETAKKALDYLDFQRCVDVFLDEMRAGSMVAIREGFRELGAVKSNQVVIFENLMDSKSLYLTGNSETVYALAFLDLKNDGPIVIESPPNVLGFMDDMWMRYIGDIGNAGPDRGEGGKYVILPPGFEGEEPEGYHVYRSKTYSVWLGARGFLVNGDPAPAVNSIKQTLKIYPLSSAANPPEVEYISATGKIHNTIHSNDYHFYEEINSLIQEEHEDAIDVVDKGRLALIGIEKGKEFSPDRRMRELMNEAAIVGATIARALSFASVDDQFYLYPKDDKTWFSAFALGHHEFLSSDWLHRDARSIFMYNAIGITPAMTVKMVGIGSQYAAAARDSQGNYLDGNKTYKLTLPPNIPAQDFWSIVLYDPQTRSMLQTDAQYPSLNNLIGTPETNPNGSVDVYFGPEAPAGKENNWIQTVPGKAFWLIFRLYGPLEPWFDQTWRPGKIRIVN